MDRRREPRDRERRDTSAIGVDVTVALFVRIDTAAAGTQNILNTRSGSAGLRLRRVRIDAATQRLEWLVGSQTVTRSVPAGRWFLVIARRSATLMSLRVDDAETDMVTAAQTSAAGTSQQLALAGGALRSHVDELAVWDIVLTDAQVDALVERGTPGGRSAASSTAGSTPHSRP